jgi:hypothetical protein
MDSKTGIWNLALGHLGVGTEIASPTERSAEASACRRFWDTAIKQTLRDFPWPFATRYIELGLVEEDPTSEWAYSYRYPSDCLYLRRIFSGNRNDNQDSRIPYILGGDDDGQLILTDMEDAECEYTTYLETVSDYPEDFVMASSLRLAHLIAPKLTKGDPYKLGENAFRLYRYELSRARANSLNEQQFDNAPESEFIRARS